MEFSDRTKLLEYNEGLSSELGKEDIAKVELAIQDSEESEVGTSLEQQEVDSVSIKFELRQSSPWLETGNCLGLQDGSLLEQLSETISIGSTWLLGCASGESFAISTLLDDDDWEKIRQK